MCQSLKFYFCMEIYDQAGAYCIIQYAGKQGKNRAGVVNAVAVYIILSQLG